LLVTDLGSFAVGLVPSYASIGIWAPFCWRSFVWSKGSESVANGVKRCGIAGRVIASSSTS